jgi:hypothetical protein
MEITIIPQAYAPSLLAFSVFDLRVKTIPHLSNLLSDNISVALGGKWHVKDRGYQGIPYPVIRVYAVAELSFPSYV